MPSQHCIKASCPSCLRRDVTSCYNDLILPREVWDRVGLERTAKHANSLIVDSCTLFCVQAHITSLPADVLSTPMGRMLAPMLGGVESQLGSVQQGDGPLQLQSPIPGVALPQYQPDPTQPATQPAVSDDAPNLSTSEQHETAASAAASVYHSAAKVARGDQGGAAAVAVGNQTKQDATLKGQVNPADAKGKAQAQESNSRESHVRQV